MKDLKIDGLEVLGTEEMMEIQGGNDPRLISWALNKGVELGLALYDWWNAPAHMPDITSNQA